MSVILTLLVAVYGGLCLRDPHLLEAGWYSREAIAHGQLWRLLTGHLAHLSAAHLLMNVVAFAVLAALLERRTSNAYLLKVLLLLMTGSSIGLYCLVPELWYYAGISALNYGLLAHYLTLQSDKAERGDGGIPSRVVRRLILASLVLHCLVQAYTGASLVPGGPVGDTTLVAWQAHLLALIIGIIIPVPTTNNQQPTTNNQQLPPVRQSVA